MTGRRRRGTGGWSAGPDGLGRGSLLISFQRFARPDGELADLVPPSLGALPVAASGDGFVLPLADEEAFWIGLTSRGERDRERLVLEAVIAEGRLPLTAQRHTPELSVVPGIPRGDRRWAPFDRRSLLALEVSAGSHATVIHALDPLSYTAATGQPAPPALDPTAGYGGWRLP